jgi:hypothetical protein
MIQLKHGIYMSEIPRQNLTLQKMKDRKIKQVLSGDRHQWKEEGNQRG